jgi:hypothetical protein
LFSAIAITSLVKSVDDLKPDYQQQAALLLYQQLNGLNQTLASISNPTIPHEPAPLAIVVNCLWCTSLVIGVGTGSYAMVLKWWLREYTSGANESGNRLKTNWSRIRALITFLPTIIIRSIDFYFAGGIVYFWQLNENKVVVIVCLIAGGIPISAYYMVIVFPTVRICPPSHYSIFTTKNAVTRIVDPFVYTCCFILHWVAEVVLFPGIQSISSRCWCPRLH